MTQLSKNFTLAEMVKTTKASSAENPEQFNPDETIVDSLKWLAQNALQPIRDYFDAPISVLSGYRTKTVNEAVNGSKNSDHIYGYAADIHFVPRYLQDFAFMLKNTNFRYHQIILYINKSRKFRFIHISRKRLGNAQQLMIATGKAKPQFVHSSLFYQTLKELL